VLHTRARSFHRGQRICGKRRKYSLILTQLQRHIDFKLFKDSVWRLYTLTVASFFRKTPKATWNSNHVKKQRSSNFATEPGPARSLMRPCLAVNQSYNTGISLSIQPQKSFVVALKSTTLNVTQTTMRVAVWFK